MLEVKGNIWDFWSPSTPICIPTNKVVKDNGDLVMGAGLALEATKRMLGTTARDFGDACLQSDGKVCLFSNDNMPIVAFPTKNHFKDKSSIEILEKSLGELWYLVTHLKFDKWYLPRIGCGLGGLSWEKEVKPWLEKFDFQDKLVFVHNGD